MIDLFSVISRRKVLGGGSKNRKLRVAEKSRVVYGGIGR